MGCLNLNRETEAVHFQVVWGECFVCVPDSRKSSLQHRAEGPLLSLLERKKREFRGFRSFPPRSLAVMWLSWDTLKSIGFGYMVVC